MGEVRGLGLIAAVELVANKETRENFDPKLAVAPTLVNKALEHGAILRAMAGDAIAFSPPLVITGDELDLLVDGFAKALDETLDWLVAEGHFSH